MGVTTDTASDDIHDEFISEIVDAATACFRRYGVRKTTIGDIAGELAVHRPRIYKYFRDKDELIAAVTIREMRALSTLRSETLAIRGPVGPVMTKALVAGLDRLQQDPFLSEVMGGDYTGLTLRLLADNQAFLEAEREWWQPVIDHGRKRGEIREDLTDDEIIGWFLLQQITTFQRQAMFTSPAAIRAHIGRFVVAAVLTARGG